IAVVRAPGGELLYANATLESLFAGHQVAAAVRGECAAFESKDPASTPYPAAAMPFALVMRDKAEGAVDDLVLRRPRRGKGTGRASGRPILTAAGEVSHVVLVYQDITREVAAEAARRQAELERAEMLANALSAREQAAALHARIIEVVDHSPVVLFATDKNGV